MVGRLRVRCGGDEYGEVSTRFGRGCHLVVLVFLLFSAWLCSCKMEKIVVGLTKLVLGFWIVLLVNPSVLSVDEVSLLSFCEVVVAPECEMVVNPVEQGVSFGSLLLFVEFGQEVVVS